MRLIVFLTVKVKDSIEPLQTTARTTVIMYKLKDIFVATFYVSYAFLLMPFTFFICVVEDL